MSAIVVANCHQPALPSGAETGFTGALDISAIKCPNNAALKEIKSAIAFLNGVPWNKLNSIETHLVVEL